MGILEILKRTSRLQRIILLITLSLALIAAIALVTIQDELIRMTISDIVSPVLNGLATIGLALAARKTRSMPGRISLAWTALAVAQFCAMTGDSLWLIYEVVMKVSPYPSPADAVYLLYYPLFFFGILLFPSRHLSKMEWIKRALDVSTVMIASAIVFWVFLIHPSLVNSGDVSLIEKILSAAYPVGDLILIFGIMVILYYQTRQIVQGSIWFVALALLVMVVYDTMFGYQNLQGTYQSGGVLDIFWLLSIALITFGGVYQAAAPAYRESTTISPAVLKINEKFSNVLSYLPYIWVGAVYLLLEQVFYNPDLQMQMARLYSMTGFVLALVLLRQIITIRENEHLVFALGKSLDQLKRQAAELDQSNMSLRQEIDVRREVEAKLTHRALYDGLTGLANRFLFMTRLEHAITMEKRVPNAHSAILFLDLDNFKAINDGLGHSSGDLVLMEMAPRLQKCVRSVDTVARFGGDEFAILLENSADADSPLKVAKRLMTELETPLIVKGMEVRVSCSIGIVQTIADYQDPEEILRDVDIAMYQAKTNGKARLETFTLDMRKSAITRLTLENDLRRGIQADEFILHYQPIYSVTRDRIIGVEALARWNHPTRGLLLPSEFIGLAEKSGIIIQLGEWVLHEACSQVMAWTLENSELTDLEIYINVSGIQISQVDFKQQILYAIQQTGIDPHHIKLEITENAFIENQSRLNDLIQELNGLGVTFVIDDFGTGYSSLAYLKNMPVTTIKIDRSFIKEIQACKKDFEIIKAIVTMAQGLEIQTIAEGIETEEQLKRLVSLQCTYYQGFYLSTPMNAYQIRDLLF